MTPSHGSGAADAPTTTTHPVDATDTRDATATSDTTDEGAIGTAPPRGRRRRVLDRVVMGAAVVFALVALGVAFASTSPISPEDDVRRVGSTLRCPSCAGEAVADSPTPLAESMRLVIAEQRAQGRSPEEIRAWFAARYGPDVLLDPPREDVGLVVWLAPLVVVAVAAASVGAAVGAGVSAAVGGQRGRRRPVMTGVGAAVVAVAVTAGVWSVTSARPNPPVAASTTSPDPTDVLQDAVRDDPGSTGLRTALAQRLEQQDRHAEAAEEYAAMARLEPLNVQAHYREGLSRFKAGDLDGATGALRAAHAADPDHADSLLLLGTLLQREHDPEAVVLLRRFVEVAPTHVAAPQIRTWLTEQEETP